MCSHMPLAVWPISFVQNPNFYFLPPHPPPPPPPPHTKKKKKSKPLFYFNKSFQKPKILTFEPFYDIQVEGKGMEPINQNFYLSF